MTSLQAVTSYQLQTDMGPGINYGQHFEAKSNGGPNWNTDIPTISLPHFQAIYNKGFRHVRIPVQWGHRTIWPTTSTGRVTIKQQFKDRVLASVDNALAANLVVIINTHHEDWYQRYKTKEGNPDLRRGDASGSNYYKAAAGDPLGRNADEVLMDIYREMATLFSGDAKYDRVIFEGLNEPRIGSNSTIGNFSDAQINTLNNLTFNTLQLVPNLPARGTPSRRVYMLTVNDANSNASFNSLVAPTRTGWSEQEIKDRSMITIHYYYKYEWTHNPDNAASTLTTWGSSADYADLALRMDRIRSSVSANFTAGANSRLIGVPVNIGEFGVQHYTSRNQTNIDTWYGQVRNYARTRGFTTTVWDDHGNFRIFNKSSGNFSHSSPYIYRNNLSNRSIQ